MEANIDDVDRVFEQYLESNMTRQEALLRAKLGGSFPDKFLADLEIVEAYLNSGRANYSKLPEVMQNSEEVAMCATKTGFLDLIKQLPEKFRSNPQIMVEAVKSSGYSYDSACGEAKDDRTVQLEALKNEPNTFMLMNSFEYMKSKPLFDSADKETQEFLITAAADSKVLEEMSKWHKYHEIVEDKDFLKKVLEKNPQALEHFPGSLKNDPELVKISQDGMQKSEAPKSPSTLSKLAEENRAKKSELSDLKKDGNILNKFLSRFKGKTKDNNERN